MSSTDIINTPITVSIQSLSNNERNNNEKTKKKHKENKENKLPTFEIICGWKNAPTRLNRDYKIQELEDILKSKNINVVLEKGPKKVQLINAIINYCTTTATNPPVVFVDNKEKVESNTLTEELDNDYDDFHSVSSGFSDDDDEEKEEEKEKDDDDNNYDICLRKCNTTEVLLINSTRKNLEHKKIEELQKMLKKLNIKDTISCDEYDKNTNKGILINYLCRNALDESRNTKK